MNNRRPLAVKLLAILLFGAIASGFGEIALADDQPTRKPGRLYVHPDRLFILRVPQDAIVRKGSAQGTLSPPVVIRSNDGYVLSVQVRPIPLEGSVGNARPTDVLKIQEGIFLGEGKAWSDRVSAIEPIAIDGLEGVQATYRGLVSQGMIAIARGRHHDFVFMFFAPPDRFDQVSWAFGRYMEGFEASASERPGEGLPASQAPFQGQEGAFSNESLGYALRAPKTWTARFVQPNATVFAPPGPDAKAGVKVVVQNISGLKAADVLEGWRKKVAATVAKSAFGPIQGLAIHTAIGPTAAPWQEVRYVFRGVPYRQYGVAIPRPKTDTVHLFTYDAPDERFDRHSASASQLLRTWRFISYRER